MAENPSSKNPFPSAAIPYAQDISGCEAHVSGAAMQDALAAAAQAREWLRKEHQQGRLPHLDVPFWQDDLPELEEVARFLRPDCDDIVVFGTGGSSLGGQALRGIARLRLHDRANSGDNWPDLHFLDNLESPWLERRLAALTPHRTRFLVISKSGTTVETVVQAIMALEYLKEAGLAREVPERMVLLTAPDTGDGDNVLRRIAADHGIRVVEHPADIGGRYSVLTCVGMLPALLMGLDPRRLRSGAASVVACLLQGAGADCPPLQGAAMQAALLREKPVSAMVTMPYTSRLRLFGAWLQQLWAESLGKNGFGTLPVTAIGPVDQHSQLQLYLDGPNDKLFNIIRVAPTAESFHIPPDYARYTELAGCRVCDLSMAQQEGTVRALRERGRPVRVFRLPDLGEHVIGALFMHFMVETILVARMHGVNPFDQPAVELLKAHARQASANCAP